MLSPLLLLVLLAGCSGSEDPGPPEIASFAGSAEERPACEALAAALPDSLADEDRVEAEPGDGLGAAYGDPAITVSCGVPVPDDFDQTARCDEVDGVGWFIPDRVNDSTDVDLRISAAGYRPVLEVVVPAELRPQDPRVGDNVTAAVLAQLSPLVAEDLTLEERCDG